MSKKKDKTTINNWNFNFGELGSPPSIRTISKWIIILIVVSNLFGASSSKLSENKDVYKKCVDTCDDKLEIGDIDYSFKNPPNQHITKIDTNRKGCIQECNGMYLRLRNK